MIANKKSIPMLITLVLLLFVIIEIVPPYQEVQIQEVPHQEIATMSIPTPELKSIDILMQDIIDNNIGNKQHYSMEGSAKDVHVCGNMAVEQCMHIQSNYKYETGITLLWCKYNGDSHAQTWVIIDTERYVIESTSDCYWSEEDHKNEFGSDYKICFVTLSKGKEHVKSASEYYRTGN